jgi:ribulose-5-phosphate 4-epimerase/fuculose-1-phosphate aldolase
VFHVGALMGEHVPVWDIAERFGDTDLLVSSMEQAEDLTHALATHTAALMRGHGCVVVGSGLQSALAAAIYMHINARLQLDAARLGPVHYLSPEEVRGAARANLAPLAVERAWEYWKRRALPSGASRD